MLISGYEERLGKTGQVTSTLKIKLNTMSLVASEQGKEGVTKSQDVKKHEF